MKDFSFELSESKTGSDLVCLGIGGLHHAPEFSKRIERKEALISHVCPKYMLESVSYQVLLHSIERSVPKINCILFYFVMIDFVLYIHTKKSYCILLVLKNYTHYIDIIYHICCTYPCPKSQNTTK